MTSPCVSVVLPVYNGAAFVREAIDSILAQTLADFELIVIDDGSKDNTAEIVESVQDSRLRFFRQENRGLATTLNRGISLAHGKYIARQDHDDLSLPARFEKQVAYLEAHPDCALLGTRSTIWAGATPTGRGHDHPSDDAALRFLLLFDCPFVHSSVMLRRSAIVAEGGYTTDPARQPPEDYELWSRLARRHKLANLPDRLLIYRELPNSIVRTTRFQDKLARLCAENLAYAAGEKEPTRDMMDIAALLHQVPSFLSPHPSLRRMRKTIRAAAARIHKTAPTSDVLTCANEVIRTLRARLAVRRFGWARPFARFLRGVVKFFRA
ncbi:MAG: glycosyltransferase [Alphaproteobacteria bacterium]|nr:glycosyltransferase [Alphaproteobacteria bacterium]